MSIKNIKYIAIDTNIFQSNNFDFAGRNSKMLESLRDLCVKHHIKLLLPSVIENEVKEHILSDAHEKVSKFKSIFNYFSKKGLLKDGDFNFNLIEKDDLHVADFNKYIKSFKTIRLLADDIKPEQVLNMYFTRQHPFSQKKKEEFPDAFAIESIKKFLSLNKKTFAIVISNDGDWKKSFENQKNVIFFDGLFSANNYLIKDFDEKFTNFAFGLVNKILALALNQLVDQIKDLYVYVDDNPESEIEEITSIDFDIDKYYDITLLYFDEEKFIFAIKIPLSISATINIFDETSPWDSEEKDFAFKWYNKENCEVAYDIYFELEIEYNKEESEITDWTIKNINHNEAIMLDISDDYR